MRHTLIALSLLLGTAVPGVAWIPAAGASSAVSINIGLHFGAYPELVLVPGYPVYYAPQLPANYFFYDGYYWLYHDDRWYMSDWYDGPWTAVDPDEVPLFVLRVPVRYYLSPPSYFYGWYVDAAPRWHIHWGPRWTRYHYGWEHWDRRIVYAPAPLPLYQRHYSGERYPRGEYRHVIHREHYRYRPHDSVVRERHQRRQEAPRPQVHARPDFQGSPRPQREHRPDWNRTPSMPPQPSAVPRQPAAVPQQPSAVPAQPRMAPPPQQEPRFQHQAPRERGERGEFRGPGPQRAAPQAAQPRPQQAAPRAQQAPRPQFQQRAPQMRGEGQPPRGNFERRQGGERGPGERGPGRG